MNEGRAEEKEVVEQKERIREGKGKEKSGEKERRTDK